MDYFSLENKLTRFFNILNISSQKELLQMKIFFLETNSRVSFQTSSRNHFVDECYSYVENSTKTLLHPNCSVDSTANTIVTEFLEKLRNPEFHEKLLVIQDKFIRDDGNINFPTVGIAPDVHSTWCPEYYGDIVFINGKAWPFLSVLRTKCNAANARFFVMTLSHPNVVLNQIGTDGGYLPKPVNRTSLTLGPGERLDFILDFIIDNHMMWPLQLKASKNHT